MNILTFDIEEWYLEKIQHGGRTSKYLEYDEMFLKLLDLLDDSNIKATFFCVGELARLFPNVIREISNRGHEVGCHSNKHNWLNKMDSDMLRIDTIEALKMLEDIAGQKVVSYRAPAFSITQENKWAVNILADCGIENDCSIFPTNRDFGGFKDFPQDTPCIIRNKEAYLKEYPICLTNFFFKRMAYSGGGYFRLLPYWMILKAMNNRDYNICYFHLNDLVNQRFTFKSKAEYEEIYKETGTLKNRIIRYAKSNIGNGDSFGKMSRLLSEYLFVSVSEADKMIEWNKMNTVTL